MRGGKAIWDFIKGFWLWIVMAFTVILGLSITVQVFREAPYPDVAWLHDTSVTVYKYFGDWATILSASVTLLLVIAAFAAISDNRNFQLRERRRCSLERIRTWAEETLNCFGKFAHREPIPELPELKDAIMKDIHPVLLRGAGIVYDANNLGKEYKQLSEKVNAENIALVKALISLGGKKMKEIITAVISNFEKMIPGYDATETIIELDSDSIVVISSTEQLFELLQEHNAHLSQIIEQASIVP